MEAETGYKISFNSVSNRMYTVESTVDLQAGWSDMTNGLVGNSDLIETIDHVLISNQFYRLKVHIQN